jgi:hypothetical protein
MVNLRRMYFRLLQAGIGLVVYLFLSGLSYAQEVSFSGGYNVSGTIFRDPFFDLVNYENQLYYDQEMKMPTLMHGVSIGLTINTSRNLNFELGFSRKSSISQKGYFGDRFGTYECKFKRIIGTGSLGLSFFSNPKLGISYDFVLFRVRWKRYNTPDGTLDGWGKLFNAPDVKNGLSLFLAYHYSFVEFKPFIQFLTPAQMLMNDGTISHSFSATNAGLCISFFLSKKE